MQLKTQLYIDGKWLDGASTIPVTDPSNESVIANVSVATDAQCALAVDAASRAFKTWSKTAPRLRGEILRKAFEIMVAEADRLAEIISKENGKVLTDAKGEILYAAEFFRWFSEEAVRINGEFRMAPSGDKRILVTKQPVGVSLLITPWNFPAAMATRKIGPALAAGCTVAIQTAAGVAAIVSAIPELSDNKVLLTLGIITVLTYINLRGVKEAGIIFVLPSYLFIFSMFVVFVFGIWRNLNSDLMPYPTNTPGLIALGEPQGLLSLAAILLVLKAFANGSASLTGLEAISDSVALFKEPEHNNARKTLMIMSAVLATLITGIAWLAYQVVAIPYESGTPTVISLVAQAALGDSAFGQSFYYFVQASTTFILFAGANTCFNAFPNMVNIVAADGFLPKQLTKRGHRLAFSNGIIFISGSAGILVIASGASITALAAIYALAVFIGFTLTGLGMAKKTKNQGAKYYLHLTSGLISLLTVIILSSVKFAEGTWLVVIGTPIVAVIMLKFNDRYAQESKALLLSSKDSRATSITRHDVTVLVDRIDIATVGAVRYARSLNPRNLNAVHFVIDDLRAARLAKAWAENPAFDDVSLQLIDCPDRRLANSVVDYATIVTASNNVELTLLLPRRAYSKFLGRLLHDQTAETIAGPISQLPRVVATIIPFDVQKIISGRILSIHNESKTNTAKNEQPIRAQSAFTKTDTVVKKSEPISHYAENMTPISSITWRMRAHVQGKVNSIKAAPSDSSPLVEVEIWDESGGVTLQFLGRREISGLEVGSEMRAEGMVGENNGQLVILNPSYEIVI